MCRNLTRPIVDNVGGIDLERTLSGDPAAVPDAAAPIARGTLIGRFLVLEERGQGGMGRVYAAYDPELDRRVAIKLVRPDRAPAGHEAASLRLVREGQSMAKLNHPNVVAIYDVGAFDDQVFLAMELIDGPDLASWLAAEPRGWREVLGLYEMAGRGLAAAHAAGLVHRDFKPANVIVSGGVAKVGDFGLARYAADVDGSSSGGSSPSGARPSSAVTEPGAVVGTPRYMAPEQRLGRSGPQADQYSFCRAMADLLDALARPAPAAALSTTREEADTGLERPQRAHPEPAARTAPPAPSAFPRRTLVGSPPRAVRKVIERGLAQDPAARWPSMDALLDALARARRGRTRLVAGIAGAIVLAAASAAGALAVRTSDSPAVCADGRAGLAGAWDDAARTAARARLDGLGAAATFTAIEAALDDYAARWSAMHTDTCRATHVRREQSPALMDLRFACLAARREELRTLAGQLATAEAAAVPALARAAHALSPLSVCASATGLSAPTPPPADPASLAAIAVARAALAEAKVLGQVGKLEPALARATATLEDARARGWRPLIAEAALEAGMLGVQAGKLDDAERLLEEATWFAEAARHDRAAAEAWTVLVFAVVQRGTALERADAWARRADAAIERAGGDRDLRARLLNHLGAVAYMRGDYAGARTIWQQSLDASRAFLPADHPDVARVENNLGIAADTVGDAAAAEAHYGRAITAWEKALGPRHPLVGSALTNRGSLKRGRGDLDGAIADYRRSIEIFESALGAEHPNLGDPLVNLGNALLPKGDIDGAVAVYQRALAIRERAFGADSPQVANVLASLGAAHRQAGAHDRSLDVLDRALAIQRAKLDPGHASTAITLTALGETHLSRRDPAAARPRFEEAVRSFEKAHGRRHMMTAYALTGLARTLVMIGEPVRAIPLAEDALAARETAGDAGPLAETRITLARALWRAGRDRARARDLVDQARPHLTGKLDPDVDPAVFDRDTAQ